MNFINVESALQSLNRSETYKHTLTRSLSKLFFGELFGIFSY